MRAPWAWEPWGLRLGRSRWLRTVPVTRRSHRSASACEATSLVLPEIRVGGLGLHGGRYGARFDHFALAHWRRGARSWELAPVRIRPGHPALIQGLNVLVSRVGDNTRRARLVVPTPAGAQVAPAVECFPKRDSVWIRPQSKGPLVIVEDLAGEEIHARISPVALGVHQLRVERRDPIRRRCDLGVSRGERPRPRWVRRAPIRCPGMRRRIHREFHRKLRRDGRHIGRGVG